MRQEAAGRQTKKNSEAIKCHKEIQGVCVCVCVCVGRTVRETERERECSDARMK